MNKFSPNLNSKTLRPNINVLPCSPTVTNAWCACLPFRVSLGCSANRSRLIFYTPLSKVLFKIELYCISVCLSPWNWNSVHTACIGSLRHTNQPALCTACIYARTASHAPCTPGARPPPPFWRRAGINNKYCPLPLSHPICSLLTDDDPSFRVGCCVGCCRNHACLSNRSQRSPGTLNARTTLCPCPSFSFFSLPKLSQNRTKYFYSKP